MGLKKNVSQYLTSSKSVKGYTVYIEPKLPIYVTKKVIYTKYIHERYSGTKCDKCSHRSIKYRL